VAKWKIIYAYADTPGEGNCSNWLCAFPATALSKVGYDVTMMHVSTFANSPPEADIIVIERLLWNGMDSVKYDQMRPGPSKLRAEAANLHVHDAIRACQDRGSKVIAVFDDHYMAYPSGPGFDMVQDKWLNGTGIGFVPIEHFLTGLGLVDAVMVPSRFLAERYGKYARRMYYVHNRPDLRLYPALDKPPRIGRMRVGWSGTIQHYVSWKGNDILDALHELRDIIIVCGIIDTSVADMLRGRDIPVERHPLVKIEDFHTIVAGYDIGICPLNGEYDRARSWIKWLECSLMGRPVVAQDNGVYDECVGGFRVSDADGWYNAIRSLFDDNIYSDMSAAGRAWAWQQGWDTNLDELLTVFREVVDD